MTKLTKFQQKQCMEILDKLIKKPISKPFQQNLSENFGLPEPINVYLAKPIDLLTIRKNLENEKYRSIQEWSYDVFLVFDNALALFNVGSPINAIAKDLRNWFEKKVKNFPRTSNEQWLIVFNSTHEKLQKLVDSYPKSKFSPSRYSQEEDLSNKSQSFSSSQSSQPSQSYHKTSHNHDKNENNASNNKITKQSNTNKVSLFDNDELEDDLEDDNSHSSSYSTNYSEGNKAIIAEDPRKKEKKKIDSVQLFPDLF